MSPENPGFRVDNESKVTSEGIGLKFVNPESLRAFILSPKKWGRTTLAERISGIREIPLGEALLDGLLFESVRFTLILEPDQDPRGGRPTAIIRADHQLGELQSATAQFQTAKSTNQEERIDLLGKVHGQFDSLPQSNKQEVLFMQYTGNTARISPPLEKETFPKLPLALLQVWDKDEGPGTISVSLISFPRYGDNWNDRTRAYGKKDENGWKTDYDEVDSWHFDQPVGVSVYEAENFYRSLDFFETAYPLIMRVIYQTEGVEIPTLNLEIESPLVLREREEVLFQDIGGQKSAVDFMRSLIEMEKSGQLLPRRPFVLLVGPPGNGKSTLSQATANELGAKLLVVTTKDLPPAADDSDFQTILEAGYFEAKATAKLKGKAVYSIEGLEIILGNNPRSHDRFLNLMDSWANDLDSNVLVIGTSNFPQQLHPGIVSRSQQVDMLKPTREGLAEILDIHAKKLAKLVGQPDFFGNVNFGQIAETMVNLMQDVSGRDAEAFLAKAYYLKRLREKEGAPRQPIDSKFLVNLIQRRSIGFQIHSPV